MKLVIKQCFEDLYTIARCDIQHNYSDYKDSGRLYDMARALVFLRDVAQNPDKHFSIESTNDAWEARAEAYMQTDNSIQAYLKKHPEHEIYKRKIVKTNNVKTPSEIVVGRLEPLFNNANLYIFCKEVKNFYYKDLYPKSVMNVKFITKYAKKVHKLATIAKQKNLVIRGITYAFNGRGK